MSGIDYDCAGCGVRHEGADGTDEHPYPIIEAPRPDAYLRMAPRDRLLRASSSDTVCTILTDEGTQCFVAGFLVIPVEGEESQLDHLAWAQVSEVDYLDFVENWAQPWLPPTRDATLASAVPGYEESLSVPVQVLTHGWRPPLIVPDLAADHPLALDARDGISRAEAELRVRSILLEEMEV